MALFFALFACSWNRSSIPNWTNFPHMLITLKVNSRLWFFPAPGLRAVRGYLGMLVDHHQGNLLENMLVPHFLF